MAEGLREAYEKTVKANKLTTDVDAALIEAGRTMAGRIQDAVDEGEGQEVTKALYLTPHLMNILREMGATPASRMNFDGGKKEGSGGKLGQLRGIAGGKSA